MTSFDEKVPAYRKKGLITQKRNQKFNEKSKKGPITEKPKDSTIAESSKEDLITEDSKEF